MNLTRYLQPSENNKKYLSKLDKLLNNLDEDFKKQYILGLITLYRMFGLGEFRVHNSRKLQYDNKLEAFSCNKLVIRFKDETDKSEIYLLITSAVCQGVFERRTPIIQIKKSSTEHSIIRLDKWNILDNDMTPCEEHGSNKQLTNLFSIRTQLELFSNVYWNEDFFLRPIAEEWLKKNGYNVSPNHPTSIGYVDIVAKKDDARDVYIELKFIKNKENPIGKLRKAIGQVLLYAYSEEILNSGSDIEKWIILNKVDFDDNLLGIMKKVEDNTGIRIFTASIDEKIITSIRTIL